MNIVRASKASECDEALFNRNWAGASWNCEGSPVASPMPKSVLFGGRED